MRSIAIVLGDNDFGLTFHNLMVSLRDAIISSVRLSRTLEREDVRKLVFVGIRYHFLAFQEAGRESSDEEIEATVKYLEEGVRVLFDDEADADMLNIEHDGGAWHLLIAENQINAY